MNKNDFNIVPYEEILSHKRKKRSRVKNLKSSGVGKCIHVGKISPGCKTCFKKLKGCTVTPGTRCNTKNCTYCINNARPETDEKKFVDSLSSIYRDFILDTKFNLYCLSITHGEPLLYMDRIEKAVNLISKIEAKMDINIWKKIYTNGTLFDQRKFDRLEELGISEIRFHTSASNFSEKAFMNLEEACKRDFVVNVEEPAYPPNSEKLLNSLSRYEEAGIDHMQVGEVIVYDFSAEDILKENPDGRYYLTNEVFLYHEGLTYEIMNEVSRRDYSYSVLDCSSEIRWLDGFREKGSIELGDMNDVFASYPEKPQP